MKSIALCAVSFLGISFIVFIIFGFTYLNALLGFSTKAKISSDNKIMEVSTDDTDFSND